jgi:hypothetical protein
LLFLDNVNDTILRSDLLASALTEPLVRVRWLGTSRMLPLNPMAFVSVTGNGVTLGEDLVRRFVVVKLDPGMEDPEARPFPVGFLNSISAAQNRGERRSWAFGDISRQKGRPSPESAPALT